MSDEIDPPTWRRARDITRARSRDWADMVGERRAAALDKVWPRTRCFDSRRFSEGSSERGLLTISGSRLRSNARAQADDQTGNAAHTESVLTPVAGCQTFVPSWNYATKPTQLLNDPEIKNLRITCCMTLVQFCHLPRWYGRYSGLAIWSVFWWPSKISMPQSRH